MCYQLVMRRNESKGVGRGRKSGWTHNFPLQITAQGGSGAVKQQQYPIALEGRVGLKAVTQTVLKDGLLEPCLWPYNTPILSARKADGTYRLVQDVRK